MKTQHTNILLLACLIYFPAYSVAQNGQNSPSSTRLSTARAALIDHNRDFRLFFTDSAELQDRIQRGVVAFDGKWARIGKLVELQTGPNMTVADLLQRTGMENWNGVPTIKLISKSVIAKNSGVSTDPDDPMIVSKFLQLRVLPGDVVVVSPVH